MAAHLIWHPSHIEERWTWGPKICGIHIGIQFQARWCHTCGYLKGSTGRVSSTRGGRPEQAPLKPGGPSRQTIKLFIPLLLWFCWQPHAIAQTTPLPKNWAACGPNYSSQSHTWGAACDYAHQTTGSTYAWASYAVDFSKGQPVTYAAGVAAQLGSSVKVGSAVAALFSVTTAGATMTTTATTGSVGQRFALPLVWNGWSFCPIVGGQTGAARSWTASVRVGYSW